MSKRLSAGVASVAAWLLLSMTPSAALAHQRHDEGAEASLDASQPSRATAPSPAEAQPHRHDGPALSTAPGASERPLAYPENDLPAPLAWLGRFHPPLTHFPIALLTAAAIAELLFIRTGGVHFEHAVRFSVWFGAIGAFSAAALGWLSAGFQLFDAEWLLTAHRWSGTGTALLAAGLLVLCERANRAAASRQSFRVALFASAALVGATGFLGGALIHGLDHYAWQVSR